MSNVPISALQRQRLKCSEADSRCSKRIRSSSGYQAQHLAPMQPLISGCTGRCVLRLHAALRPSSQQRRLSDRFFPLSVPLFAIQRGGKRD